jgi:hypothetical protein
METDSQILILAIAATAIAKTVVDLVRMAHPKMKGWLPPTIAVAAGCIATALLQVSNAVAWSPQAVATTLLSGILAGGAAAGVTEIGKRAESARGGSS